MINFPPPENNNLNRNTSHPIIERVQNYNLHRKLLTIHSSDRDTRAWPFSHEFSIKCPQQYINIQSMRLLEIQLPAMYYNFSNAKQNTTFIVELLTGDYIGEYTITIPDGFYNPTSLQNVIEYHLNKTITLTNELITSYTGFKVFYNEVTEKYSFGNNLDCFHLLFDKEILYIQPCCPKNNPPEKDPSICSCDCIASRNGPCGQLNPVFNNSSNWGFPYYIGYEKKIYTSDMSQNPRDIEYLPQPNYWLTPNNPGDIIYYIDSFLQKDIRVFKFLQSEPIYLEIDKWNTYDELQPYAQDNSNSSYTSKNNGSINTAFAKIATTIYPTGQQFDSRNGLLQNVAYFDPVIERIQDFKFKFRYHDGTPVWFDDVEFNFTLEINQLQNEIPKKYNVNIPSAYRL